MAHYINVPVNANGILFDAKMNDVINEAMAVAPFGFGDVFIYSHGWSTTAVQMMDTYNRFSVELASSILTFQSAGAGFPKRPQQNLGIGIHWPSEISEDSGSLLDKLQLLTFYTMEHRADAIGRNAVYSMLRLILTSRLGSGLQFRVFLLGHSFGCKVICAALEDLQVDIASGTIAVPPGTEFRTVLLEPATDEDNLEPGDIYGNVVQLTNHRLLVTKSLRDEALTTWYLEAGRAANLFHPKPALGSAGPTPATITAFGGADSLSLTPAFSPAAMFGYARRLVVADLTAIHASRAASGEWQNGGFSGQHSDIFFDEVYHLISGFIYS